ncbi:alr3067 [Nostoc sp. PCC 7120 = FACHB-418]|nr:alr3067 [Nostoc sp. PCC 7120 = FACHB-418]
MAILGRLNFVPIISVIIPVYNGEKTIIETIASVQHQTFLDIEIIVINDGSTDNTFELVRNIQDNRLKIFSYENGGLPVARNRGITHAVGQFIAFIDADDLWTTDKLELQFAALQEYPEAGLAYSWTYYKFANEADSYADESNSFAGDVYAELLIKNFLQNGSNPLIRRAAIDSVGLFDPTLKSCEDWDFYLRLAAKWQFALVKKAQIIYRQSPTAMTSKLDVMEKYSSIVIERAFNAAPPQLQHLKKQSLAWVYKFTAQQCLKYNSHKLADIKLAAKRLKMAITLYPKNLLEDYTHGLIRKLIKSWILLQFHMVYIPEKSHNI